MTAPVVSATINDKLSAIGTGRANNSVTVKPYASGRLTEILVTSGTEVEAGTVIARLDSEVEEIALDRAKISLADARGQARTRESAAHLEYVDRGAACRCRTRRRPTPSLQVRNAQLDFDRRAIVAPIRGIIGILPVEAGNYMTADTVIATIDDRSSIIIDFYVPERFAGSIKVGDPLTATPIARPNRVLRRHGRRSRQPA